MRSLSQALLALACLAGCGAPDEKCPEPVYRGKATDEAYLSMHDAKSKAQRGVPSSPSLQAPAAGEVFSAAAAPPTFRWTSSLQTAAPRPFRPREKTLWQHAKGLFISEAWAHLPPVTSDLYFLEFSIPGEKCPMTVLTSELSWPVEAEYWSAFAGKGTITLDLTSAYLTQNRVTEGPFAVDAPRTFEVKP